MDATTAHTLSLLIISVMIIVCCYELGLDARDWLLRRQRRKKYAPPATRLYAPNSTLSSQSRGFVKRGDQWVLE
jgi:hypothetical protein